MTEPKDTCLLVKLHSASRVIPSLRPHIFGCVNTDASWDTLCEETLCLFVSVQADTDTVLPANI